jgi:hypothetical protein
LGHLSPFVQGWETVIMSYVGIDVSKDWLDVHLAPAGEDWRVSRDAAGLDELGTSNNPSTLSA